MTNKSVNPKRIPLRDLLRLVAVILEAPRDRLGRLDVDAYDSPQKLEARRLAAESFRELAVNNCLSGSQDRLEQIAKVIRVHTEKKKNG
jgi:hypothetical protein